MKTKAKKTNNKSSGNTIFSKSNSTPFFAVQAKLNVGKPGDKYEQEADRVADTVVNRKATSPTFFTAVSASSLQTMPLANSITPLVQKAEEEEVQPKLNVQRAEEKEAQTKPDIQKQEEEEAQAKLEIQRQAEEEEETMQMQPEEEEEPIQMQEEEEAQPRLEVQKQEEEEEILQTQLMEEEEEMLQPKTEQQSSKPQSLTEQLLKSNKGNGGTMDSRTKAEMEQGFGTDFIGVRIHTDSTAVQMNKELGAQAFTSGKDIYFNNGRYNPKSQNGKKLLAHELTHTIQQTGNRIQRRNDTSISTTTHTVQGGFLGNVWRGIRRVGRGIGRGVRRIGRGIARAGRTVWSGIQKIGRYGWNVLKSAGAWVWDLVSEAPTRIWRILRHVGSAIVGNITRVFHGIRSLLGNLWQIGSNVFSWLRSGIPGLFRWIWNGLRSGASWAWRVLNGDISAFLEGVRNIFSRLGSGVVNLLRRGWEGLKLAVVWAWRGLKGAAFWLGRAILSGAAWAGRLLAKLLDLIGFGEIMDLIFNIVKFNTRTLKSVERQEAKKVFGNNLSYGQVRIDEASLIAKIGAFFSGASGMGVTLFHTINFNKKINAAPGNGDMRWLIHEMAHVSQYENVGSQYIGEAIHAQGTVGYGYGEGAGLVGKNLKDFNREQQADIIAHYYFYILSGNSDSRFDGYAVEYNRMISQARAGRF